MTVPAGSLPPPHEIAFAAVNTAFGSLGRVCMALDARTSASATSRSTGRAGSARARPAGSSASPSRRCWGSSSSARRGRCARRCWPARSARAGGPSLCVRRRRPAPPVGDRRPAPARRARRLRPVVRLPRGAAPRRRGPHHRGRGPGGRRRPHLPAPRPWRACSGWSRACSHSEIDGPPHRRERHRQGGGGARSSTPSSPRRSGPFVAVNVRRAAGRPAGERALRPRARRLHRRHRATASAASRRPRAAPSSSTRWATCRCTSR